MKQKLLLVCILTTLQLQSSTISSLLNRLEKRPEYRHDVLNEAKSQLGEQSLKDKLMPTINAYASYEIFSSPNGLLPVPPNKLTKMLKDQTIGQPFSDNILREGIRFSWPLFIKSVDTLIEKAKLLHLAARDKKRLSLIQREAVVVGSVAQLHYLEALIRALKSKKNSILQTLRTTKIKVKEGRAPQSALFVLNSHINELDIAINMTNQKSNLLRSKIEILTGVHLTRSVPLRVRHRIRKGEIFALKPLKKRIAASKKGIQAADEAYYPSVVTKGNYTFSQADAYNNGTSLSESFGSVGVYVSMPVFDPSKNTASEKHG